MPEMFHMWATFAIIAITIFAFAAEKWALETVSLAAIVAMLVLFSAFPGADGNPVISAPDLILGFANPALATVLALLIVGQALFNTEALERPAQLIAKLGGNDGRRTIVLLLIIAAVTSAFLNNTPVVVMFIPIVTAIAAQRNLDASKALMPLSFIGILGGMTTLIGSSTNLLVAGVAERFGEEIGFFDFAVPGVMLASVGAIYVLYVMPMMLGTKGGSLGQTVDGAGRQFIAQIEVTKDHSLVGRKAIAGMFPGFTEMTVRTILRGDEQILPPFENLELSEGDTVVVAATRKALTKSLATGFANISNREAAEDFELEEPNALVTDFTLAEVVVAPGSRYAGRIIEGSSIHDDLNVVVLGVQRRSRMPRGKMRDIRLEPGDTILIGGLPHDIGRLRTNRDFLLLDWSTSELPRRRHARRSLVIFGVAIGLAAFGVVPILVAALAGAFAMIAFHCINISQAARSFDARIFMLVGASLALATAMEKTGGAAYLANGLVNALNGQSTTVILSVLFLLTALLTNVLSNNATAVLFTPVAIGIADTLGVGREAFIVCIIFAANCSFATPVGYQTNLLVMGPGHYSFGDFLKAGLPLVFILWLTFTIIAPMYFHL